MKTLPRVAVKLIVLCLLLQIPFVTAADTKPAPPAPIPSPILAAKKIFIANAGSDEVLEGQPGFSGGPDRAYNEFYAAMKGSGRYQIVSSPAEADLLLQISFNLDRVVPDLRLEIRDPKNNAMLWGIKVHVQFGIGQSASDKNFDQAVSRLVANVQGLLARAAAPTEGPATP